MSASLSGAIQQSALTTLRARPTPFGRLAQGLTSIYTFSIRADLGMDTEFHDSPNADNISLQRDAPGAHDDTTHHRAFGKSTASHRSVRIVS